MGDSAVASCPLVVHDPSPPEQLNKTRSRRVWREPLAAAGRRAPRDGRGRCPQSFASGAPAACCPALAQRLGARRAGPGRGLCRERPVSRTPAGESWAGSRRGRGSGRGVGSRASRSLAECSVLLQKLFMTTLKCAPFRKIGNVDTNLPRPRSARMMLLRGPGSDFSRLHSALGLGFLGFL